MRSVNLKIEAHHPGVTSRLIRMTGFGACMIKGVPFGIQDSFLNVAIKEASAAASLSFAVDVQSWEAFPSPRLVRHYRRFNEREGTEINVVQLGSSDVRVCYPKLAKRVLQQPVSYSFSEAPNKQGALPEATYKNQLRWLLTGALGLALRVKPATSEDDYAAAIKAIATFAESRQLPTIILTPFVLGNPLSNGHAFRYTRRIKSELSAFTHVTVFDAHELLGKHKITEILLVDGLHLSKNGHQILGKALARELLRRLAGAPRPAADPAALRD